MVGQKQFSRVNRRQAAGFTIVELLIVIVVIGILAAITIVAFNGIQTRASDTSVKTDLMNITKKAEAYRAINTVYPSNTSQFVNEYAVKTNTNAYAITSAVAYNLLYCSISPYDTYAILATAASGKKFYSMNGGAVQEYTGATIWSNSNTSAICGSVLAGSNNTGQVGYNYSDTTTGPWRAWVGAN